MTKDQQTEGFEEKQLVVFRLQDEEFGVNINEVKEIMKLEEITQIPNSQIFVEGVINLRGKIIVVIDLAKKLNMITGERTKNTRVIIIEREELTVGMIVDSASEVLRITSDKIKPAPELIRQKIDGEYIQGVGILGERLLILLNLGMILQNNDIANIESIEQQAKLQTNNKISSENKTEETSLETPKVDSEEKSLETQESAAEKKTD